MFLSCVAALQKAATRRITVQKLMSLDDRMLKDIGVHRGDIDSFVRENLK